MGKEAWLIFLSVLDKLDINSHMCPADVNVYLTSLILPCLWSICLANSSYNFFWDFIYFWGGGAETEGEKHQCVVVSHAPPTGDLAINPGTCPDWELNPQPFGLQANTQSTEPHQPGNSSYNWSLWFPYMTTLITDSSLIPSCLVNEGLLEFHCT